GGGGDFHCQRIAEAGWSGLIAEVRSDVSVHVTQADRPPRALRQPPIGLSDRTGERQGIAELLLEIGLFECGAVEIEVDLPDAGTGQRLQASLEPSARIAGEREPGSIFCRQAAEGGNVWPRPARLSFLLARP